MAATISKGRLLSVFVQYDEQKLAALRKTPELIQAAMQRSAEYWQTGILPEHFKKEASEKYGYAPRTKKYLKRKGYKPSLILSGSLRRDLRSRAQFKVQRTGVELRMTARVLNLAPTMAENNQDLYVARKGTHGYPNLKRELKVVLSEEQAAIAAIVTKELEIAYQRGVQVEA